MKKNKLHYLTIKEHLEELRSRLLYCAIFFIITFLICYYFSTDLYDFLLAPLAALEKDNPDFELIYTDLTEAFFVYLKVAFLTSITLSIPFFLMQLYIYIAPGLYKHEKKVILPYLIISPILFISGVIVVYYFIFPLAWDFFISFEYKSEGIHDNKLSINFMPSVSEYLTLVIQMVTAFGLAFQLPILLTLLTKFNIIDHNTLIRKRRIAIVLIFLIAAILTPPDVMSQIGLAIPMIMLYEISIFACKRTKQVNKQP